MAYTKRVWKGRQGTGLNKFSINGATPVTVVNQPDTLTEQGDALSAGNLNDLENRIESAFNDVDTNIATETTARENADTDLKNAIDANSNRISNLEQKAGDYSVVNYRGTNAVPTGKASYGLVEKIVGKTRAWNQLVQNGNFDGSNYWNYDGSSFIQSSNIGTVIGDSNYANLYKGSIGFIVGHTYLALGYAKSSLSKTINLMMGESTRTNFMTQTVSANVKTLFYGIATRTTEEDTIQFGCVSSAGGTTIEFSEIHVHDLTLIFPEYTSAQLENLGASGVIALLPSLGQYNAYDAGSLVDTVVSGVRSVGKNLAQINNFTQSVSYGTEVPCVLKGGLTYTASGTAGGGSTLRFLKSDGTYQYIGLNENFDETFVAEGDITEATFFGEVTVSNFQVELGSSKTSFAPWVNPDTLSLSTPVTLRSAGAVSEVLTLETGKKTRPVGDINLGIQTWSYSAGIFIANCTSGISGRGANLTCSKYINAGYVSSAEMGNKTIQFLTDQIWIRDDSYNSVGSDSDPSTFLGQLQDVHAYIPLAIPDPDEQVCDPIPDNFVKVQAGGTIETIQTQTPVIDNCLDVGYLAL